ncbi:MAG: acetylxylan esterase [Dysgonomonas sp.]
MKRYLLILAVTITAFNLYAQKEPQIKVSIMPDHIDWNYTLGEKARFEIKVMRNDTLIRNADIRYEISYDMMKPFKEEKKVLKNGTLTVEGGTMNVSGFLRCRAFYTYKNKEYEGRATAGFDPLLLKATTIMPDDFVDFWNKAKEENSKIPMNAKLRLLENKSNDKVNVYELKVQNFQQESYIYGILCVPKASGKYPAILRVPGAGVRPMNGDRGAAERGIITLEIGIHGIPVTMDKEIYDNLYKAGLHGYQYANWDNRDRVYYKRVYLGCIRAIDYIFSMDEFDGTNMAVQGGSQGGALAIVTAALDNRVKGLVSFYPALCDLPGYLQKDRAGGWPHYFRDQTDTSCILEEKVKVSSYYDVVNFARTVKVPGFYSFGYNDMVCPPTSMYSAVNAVAAPKTIVIVPETAHYANGKEWTTASNWLSELFRKKIKQN